MRKLFAALATTTLVTTGLAVIPAAPPAAADTTPDAPVTTSVPLKCAWGDFDHPDLLTLFDYELSVEATAPATVAPRERFTIALTAEADLPTEVGVPLGDFSDLEVSFPIPAGATLVSASLTGGSNLGPGTPTTGIRDGAAWIRVPGPIPAGTTVTFPTLELALDAADTPGATIETRLAGTSIEDPGFTLEVLVSDPYSSVAPVCYPAPPVPVLSTTAIAGEAPSIDLVTPTDAATYDLGEVVDASYSGTGAVTCVGTVPDGSPLDTSTAGTHDFTVDATNAAGVLVSTTVTYRVSVPDVSVSGCSVAEGATCRFDVILAGPAPVAFALDYATVDGSARAGQNYTAAAGDLTFAPGETSKKVAVPTINDGVYDPADRTFELKVTSPDDPALSAATATGTVRNTTPEPLVIALAATVDEGDTGTAIVSVPVALANMYGSAQRSAVPVSVDWRNGDYNAHAPGDYALGSGTLTFAPGETMKYIHVSVAGDTLAEPGEMGLIGLSNPVHGQLAGIGPGLGFFGIRDDDPRPAASVSDITARALTSQPRIMRFTVTLNRPFESYASVDVATFDGTAVAGIDYLPVAKTVLFTPMATSREVWVWILPGSAGKNFTLALSNPVGIPIGDGVATGTIT